MKMREELRRFVWVTYRKGFDPIEGLLTDTGWGCMIRSG